MKKFFALLLALSSLLTCLGCTPAEPAETTEATTAKPAASQAARDALEGKKIIFVGNSYTHVGRVVFELGVDNLDQDTRSNDKGYFYQLCKAMGIEVSVTSWTFGGHDLTDSLGSSCTRNASCSGKDHASFLTDRNFDYVALQLYIERQYIGDMNAHLQPMMDMFRQANPDVKFLLLVPHMAYDKGYSWLNDLEAMDRSDIIVCNWGKMLHDIVGGTVQVPGATQSYARPTFVVGKDESDGHHQNLLVGYLTAAMVYSAITGDSAEGLPYDFCDDSSIDPRFDMEAFKKSHYIYEPYTNYIEVYRSEADMQGLQQLIDQYLRSENP